MYVLVFINPTLKKIVLCHCSFYSDIFFKTTQIYLFLRQNTIVLCLINLNCLMFHFT